MRGAGPEFGQRLNLRLNISGADAAPGQNLKSFVSSLLKEDQAAVSFIERSRRRDSYSGSQIEKLAGSAGEKNEDPSGLEKMLAEFKDIIGKLAELGDAPASGADPAARERAALFGRLSELAGDGSIKDALKLLSNFEDRLAQGKATLEDILNEAAQHDSLFSKGFLRSIKNGDVGAIKSVADVFRTLTSADFNEQNVDSDQLESVGHQVAAALVTVKGIYTKPEEPSSIESGLDGVIAAVKRLKKLMKEKGEALDSPDVRKAIDDEIVKTNALLRSTLSSPNFKEFTKLISNYQTVAQSPKSDARVIGDLLEKERWLVGSRVPELFRKGQSWDITMLLETFGKLENLQIDSESANPEGLDRIIAALKDAKKLIKGERKPLPDDAAIKKAETTRQIIDQLKAEVAEAAANLALGIEQKPGQALGAHAGLAGQRAAFLLVIGD